MEFLYELGLFASKGLVIVIAIVFVLMAIAATVTKRRRDDAFPIGHLALRNVNEFYKELQRCVDGQIFNPKAMRKIHKDQAKAKKAEFKKQQADEKAKAKAKQDSDKAQSDEEEAPPEPKGLFVLDFKGDIEASKVELLRNEITSVLLRTTPPEEVLVRVESTGGYVHSYGFAASQLLRIREAGIRLTVAVDRVAASGGYMMAAVADRILAAPFAVIGSIGVAAELPNLHRFLQKHDIDYEVMTAGKHKRTLTIFGENTDEHREKMQTEMDDTHSLFQDFVAEYRTQADVPAVATGETWYGARALDLNLIDEVKTSDQHIMEACKGDKEVFEITWVIPRRPFQDVAVKLSSSISWVQSWLKSLGRSS